MTLAAEEINAAGGIKIGKTMHPLQLEIIDTSDEEPGVPTSKVLLAVEKLILQKKSNVIVGGPCMSECGLAAMDLYAKYKIVVHGFFSSHSLDGLYATVNEFS